MTTFDLIASRIIKEQELIVGPMAWAEAGKVQGLQVIDQKGGDLTLSGNGAQVIDKLVTQYEHLFGRASREVCREAAANLVAELQAEEVPSSLR